MAIQWFPGHMNKARNEIKEIMPRKPLNGHTCAPKFCSAKIDCAILRKNQQKH